MLMKFRKNIIYPFCIALVLFSFISLLFTTEASAAVNYDPNSAVNYARANYTNGWACSKFVAKCVAAGGIDLGNEDGLTTTTSLKNALDSATGLSPQTLTLSSYYVRKSNNPNLQIGDVVFCYCTNHSNYPHVLIVSGFSGDYALFTCTNNSHLDIKWKFNSDWLSSSHSNCSGKIQAKAYYLSSLSGPSYTLDVNGLLDNQIANDVANYATFDMYLNGEKVADDVGDYYNEFIRAGSTYEIKDIKPLNEKEFLGFSNEQAHSDYSSGVRTGTVNSNTECTLSINTVDAEAYLQNYNPARSVEVNNHSYYLYTEPVSWYAAKTISEHLGGHLATITSAEENAIVYNLVGSETSAWLGASDKDAEGSFNWVNGEDFSYTNWVAEQPDNAVRDEEGSENYVHIWAQHNGQWNDEQSLLKIPFLCETETIVYTPSKIANYEGRTYERYDYHMAWTEAKAFCEQRGGHLVSITSESEQSTVVNLLSGCPYGFYHIGCTDPDQSNAWSWVTGESFTYSNWDQDYPEPSRDPGEFYAAIIGIDYGSNKRVGEWIDVLDNGLFDTGFYAISNSGFICEYDYDLFTYRVNADGTCIITGYKGDGGDVVVPSLWHGLTVTGIDEEAFESCESLTGVVISEGITSIGDWAFAGCTNLTSITIPNGVTSLGEGLFSSSGLVSIYLPRSVTSIVTETSSTISAFLHCSSLISIDVDENNTAFRSVDGVLFDKNMSTLIQYPLGRVGHYSIPDGVTSIGAGAFSDCTGVTSVTIPSGVTSIGERAFYKCTLKNVTIPSSVTSIGDWAFIFVSNLTDIYYTGTEAQWASIAKFEDSFLTNATIHYNWTEGNILILPEELTTIASEAFKDLPEVDTVYIPASVTSIDDDTFDPGITIKAPFGSYAITWAQENGFDYMVY